AAVLAGFEVGDLAGVAHRAVDGPAVDAHRVSRDVDAGVALDARHVPVRRMRRLRAADEERPRAAADRAREVGPGVALLAVAVGEAALVEDALHDVRLVAVDAHRHLMRPLLPQLAVDDLDVYLLDLRVALHARLRDVLAVDGRGGV